MSNDRDWSFSAREPIATRRLGPSPLAGAELGIESLRAGELVADRFRVECLAAVGGMSLVYRARDLRSGALVALKLLAHGGATSDRSFAEVEILASLSHSAIVRYLDHGKTLHETPFLVMEWLAGEDLESRLARGPLRMSECLALMRQLCAALSLAHERGVLHRDLKPRNVFLVGGSFEQIKLLDFGVAHQEAATRSITRSGALIGTVGYMAPEQARGALALDVRTDVFALGSVLFECLTGEPAFSGGNDLAVLAKVLRGESPSVSRLRPDLGEPFDALLRSLLAKGREQRPASVAAALRAFEQTYASGSFEDAPPPRPECARTSYAEQRILSVIVGQPHAGSSPYRASHAAASALLDELARDFGAEVAMVRGGAMLLVLSAAANSTATDQAARAARCALRLSEHRPDLTLGLATGAVDTTSHVPVGAAIERAAALLERDGGAIHVDRLTASLLGNRFALREGAQGLALESEYEEGDSADVLMGRSTPFVGRAKELAILQASLRECLEDQVPRAVVVMGPAGAGKSRLSRELIERVRQEQSARVLFAHCDPTTAGSPLSLVQRLIRSAAKLRGHAPVAEQRESLRVHLARIMGRFDEQLFGFLAEILGIATTHAQGALQHAARADPEVMREQKRRAFERWMSALVGVGPTLVVVEDLHWGDLPSVRYLQQATCALSQHALFLLATSRPELYTQFPALRELDLIDEISLSNLTKRASEQFARSLLPTATPEAILSKIVSLAGGNAFYLEELVRRVAEGGGAELPETVVAMAQSRIEELPPEARRFLRAASVFGETAWASGVRHLLASEDDDGGVARWLVEREIMVLRADSQDPGTQEYAFRHALLREAAYAMLPEADRRNGHLRAAEWLEARGERDARMLADHFERGGAIARAVPYIAKASMAALDGGDFESAIALSQRGASLGAYGQERGMLLLVRAYACAWKCDPELPGEALSLLPRATAPWWLALSLHVFGSSMLGAADVAEPYLKLALTTAPDAELTSAYGHAIHVLSTGAALLGRAPIGWALVAHFERASGARSAQYDPAFLAWLNLAKCILASNSVVDGDRWPLAEAIAWGHASVDAMRVLGSGSGEAAALFHLGNAYWLAGNFARSRALLQQACALAQQTRNLLVEQHATLLLAVAGLREGSPEDARITLDALARSNNLQISHAAATVLADTLRREGLLDAAIARASDAASGCSLMYRKMARGTLARAHLARGDYVAALVASESALAEGAPDSFPHLRVDLLGSCARALLHLGLREEAQRATRAAWTFREAVARQITDDASRTAFRSRGRANRDLDTLARQLFTTRLQA